MEKKTFIEQLQAGVATVTALFDRIGFAWFWLLVSILLLMLVTALNPAKFGAYLWFASKISGAAALGYGFDFAFFRGSDPRYLAEGIEKSMAQNRRVILIGCAMIAAGLIG